MRYNVGTVLADSARLMIDTVSSFRQHVANQHRSDLQALKQRAKHVDTEELDVLSDNRWLLDEIIDLADGLALVALYRVVELTTRKILLQRYEPQTAAKLYRFDRMKKRLLQDLDLDIAKIPQFRKVDELRVLNNAIKHGGEVTAELARYPDWPEGGRLSNLGDAYERFTRADSIPTYLRHLARRVVLR